jgi:hypothetical protein
MITGGDASPGTTGAPPELQQGNIAMLSNACQSNSDGSVRLALAAPPYFLEGVYIQQGRKRTSEHHPRGKGGGPPPA